MTLRFKQHPCVSWQCCTQPHQQQIHPVWYSTMIETTFASLQEGFSQQHIHKLISGCLYAQRSPVWLQVAQNFPCLSYTPTHQPSVLTHSAAMLSNDLQHLLMQSPGGVTFWDIPLCCSLSPQIIKPLDRQKLSTRSAGMPLWCSRVLFHQASADCMGPRVWDALSRHTILSSCSQHVQTLQMHQNVMTTLCAKLCGICISLGMSGVADILMPYNIWVSAAPKPNVESCHFLQMNKFWDQLFTGTRQLWKIFFSASHLAASKHASDSCLLLYLTSCWTNILECCINRCNGTADSRKIWKHVSHPCLMLFSTVLRSCQASSSFASVHIRWRGQL